MSKVDVKRFLDAYMTRWLAMAGSIGKIKKPYALYIGLTLNLKCCLLSGLDTWPLTIVRRHIHDDPVGVFYLERFVWR